jgi:type I restriction enzyme S subunit
MRRYDSYKDSGVEWIGDIPSGWKNSKLKYSSEITMGQSPSSEFYNDEGVGFPFLQGNSEFGIVHPTHKLTTTEVTKKSKVNDILFSVRGSVGEINWSDKEYCIGRGLCSISSKKLESKLLWYLLIFSKDEFLSNSVGSTFVSVNTDDVKNLTIPLPPLSEQQQIVSFLDTKTSLIDSLIEKTKLKIQLLKEKRTSLINEVVTKGLNPNVEMKDSGVEWIGEIPNHWVVKKLKNVSDVKPSNVDKHIFPDEIQVRLCNYTDVYYNDFITSLTELKRGSCNSLEFEKFKLEKGDVIITKDSESPDDIGIPCIVVDDFDDVVCGYHLTLIRPQSLMGGYIFRFIQSDRTRRYFEVHSNGITRYGLGKSSIENLSIPFPPHSEQQQIVSYLDEHTQLIDKTISVEERRIDTLKEYRQSLISEVVTGKRKVVD